MFLTSSFDDDSVKESEENSSNSESLSANMPSIISSLYRNLF